MHFMNFVVKELEKVEKIVVLTVVVLIDDCLVKFHRKIINGLKKMK